MLSSEEGNAHLSESNRQHTSANLSKTPQESTVRCRRGRWVIKLALALFLSGKELHTEGKLAAFHGEIWSYELLGREALRRQYVPPDTRPKAAQNVWKEKIGAMYVDSGFEACVRDLNPYFEREFNRIQKKAGEERQITADTANTVACHAQVADATHSVGGFSSGSTVDSALVKYFAKLYSDALRCVRGVKCNDGTDGGWVAAGDLFASVSAHKAGYMMKASAIAEVERSSLPFPTTPSGLVKVLSKLDLLGRFQFRRLCGAESEPTGEANGGAAAEGLQEEKYSVRAAWAHKDFFMAQAVLSSHPMMTLKEAIDKFGRGKRLYDFVESLDRWKAELTKGGRSVPVFRPFLLLAVGDVIESRITGDCTQQAATLLSNKVVSGSAFLPIHEHFLNMHEECRVHVVHSHFVNGVGAVPFEAAPGGESCGVVFLLPVSEIPVGNVLKNTENPQILYVKGETLYGEPQLRGVPLDALCLEAGEHSLGGDGAGGGVGAVQSCRIAVKEVVLDLPVGPQVSGSPALVNSNVFDEKSDTELDPAVWLQHLRYISQRLLLVTKESFCKEWLEGIFDSYKEDKSCEDVSKMITNVLSGSFEYAHSSLSLLVPRGRTGVRLSQKGRPPLETLTNAAGRGECDPLYISANRQRQVVVYFHADSPWGADQETVQQTVLLFLSSSQWEPPGADEEGGAKLLVDGRTAVLLLPSKAQRKNGAGGDFFRTRTAVELSVAQQSDAEAMCGICGSTGSLRSVELLVDELAFEVLTPITDIVDTMLLAPVKRSLSSGKDATLPFLSLPVEARATIIQSLRQYLLMAVQPLINETLEFLGDAVLDFVVAQETLNTWGGGPVAEATSNIQLGRSLPLPLIRYYELKFKITNKKRHADTVEAIFGALAMVLWVIPFRGEGKHTADGPLPFSVLQCVTRDLMTALGICAQAETEPSGQP
ncbi:unnamed protein product [Trypanosoma congolense IL3000]|uniref:WGS project CAEQ00000000 data, annotated contig 810 n=1 Tax=Trypanosoma congolense (strain IL3000) TaxID=1068625 RepID=F9WIL2_TRYCI|nr:unnamed protein product [Trypanosoma congolense IL3000]